MKRLLSLALSLATLLLLAGAARAQVTTLDEPAISVERLWLEPGPGGFVGGQSAEILEAGSWSIAVLASLMKDPLVLADLQSGEAVTTPVELRLGYEVAAAYSVHSRLQLGLGIPIVAAQEGDRLRGIGLSEESLAPIALADIRVHAKLRLQPDRKAALAYGIAMHAALPSGDEEHFAGERGTVLSWTMIVAYRYGGWRLAGNLALRLRTQEVVLLSPARPHGNEVNLVVAAEYALPPEWKVPMSALAEWSRVDGDAGGASPQELRYGLVAHLLWNARLKLVMGTGLTPDEVGAPAWRVAMIFERTSE